MNYTVNVSVRNCRAQIKFEDHNAAKTLVWGRGLSCDLMS